MISDSDGKHYPWYGSKTEMKTIKGPTSSSTEITVSMDDNFFPNVTWFIPDNTWGQQPRLTHIYRKQHFLTTLAIKINSKTFSLKTVAWHMEIEIDVKPESKKASLLRPFYQNQPVILDNPVKISPSALIPPNANNCQALIWRPFKRKDYPSIIVRPKESIVSIDKYLAKSRNMIYHFYRVIPIDHPLRNYIETEGD